MPRARDATSRRSRPTRAGVSRRRARRASMTCAMCPRRSPSISDLPYLGFVRRLVRQANCSTACACSSRAWEAMSARTAAPTCRRRLTSRPSCPLSVPSVVRASSARVRRTSRSTAAEPAPPAAARASCAPSTVQRSSRTSPRPSTRVPWWCGDPSCGTS